MAVDRNRDRNRRTGRSGDLTRLDGLVEFITQERFVHRRTCQVSGRLIWDPRRTRPTGTLYDDRKYTRTNAPALGQAILAYPDTLISADLVAGHFDGNMFVYQNNQRSEGAYDRWVRAGTCPGKAGSCKAKNTRAHPVPPGSSRASGS